MQLNTQNMPFPELREWFEKGVMQSLLGHDIFFIDEGERNKPTLLLIHGFPTSSWDWKKMWLALRK